MQNIYLNMKNIMSQKMVVFCHSQSRFHYSLFKIGCGGSAAATNLKRAQTNRSIGAKISVPILPKDFILRSEPAE